MTQMFPASAMPNPDWWGALWPEPERTVASLGIASGMRVVDLCCGDGLFTLPIARLAAEVVAIDLDSEMPFILTRIIELPPYYYGAIFQKTA
jgi:16S rRNA A1518/A1519 N6-dimethyltransferase RsmA/KsgA/DIM1 with predicted DNA glycosylase/AP lyase activity